MSAHEIMTVCGPIAPEALGVTSAHEHLHSDLSLHSGREDNRMTDAPTMARELAQFRRAGGRTIVEVTPAGLGRHPAVLREFSEAAGVQIVSGIGLYGNHCRPAGLEGASAPQLAAYFIREIEEGTAGLRAGALGEIASHNEPEPNPTGYRLDESERALFQGAALAQQRTGVALLTHASLGRGGRAQLQVLEQAGADPARVAIGHCDAHWHEEADRDLEYYLSLLERGACCSFDLIGWTELGPDSVRADRMAALIRLGYAEQLLLGTDTCRKSQLAAHGGRGFDYLWRAFLPLLRARGVSEAELHSLLVTAPRRLLAGV